MAEPFLPGAARWGDGVRTALGATLGAAVLVGGFLGGSALGNTTAPSRTAAPVSPQAWIDAPLDASSIPDEPYMIIAHGTSAEGVTAFEFSVDGVVVEPSLQDLRHTSDSLSYVMTMWTPPGRGMYELTMRAFDGVHGPTASVTVWVGDPPPAAPADERPGCNDHHPAP